MSRHIESYHELQMQTHMQMQNLNVNPKMNTTNDKHSQASQMIMTHHVRYIFMPDATISLMYPIQSKGIVTSQMRSVGLLQQSIPFLVATLHIMGHFSMFSLISFVAVSTEKSSSLHTIILKTKHKQSNTLSCITIKYIFLLIEIRYFILLPINTHIDCANNSKFGVRCILKATARSLESVSFCIFC